MTHLAGKGGFVSYDTGTEITGIKSWTLDYTVSVLDTTDFVDAGVSSFLPGVSQWSGTFTGIKDGPPLTVGSIYNGSMGEADTAGYVWTGSIIITGLHPSVAFDGLVEYSWDYQGTGALTIASV